jgi:hypothetical protein
MSLCPRPMWTGLHPMRLEAKETQERWVVFPGEVKPVPLLGVLSLGQRGGQGGKGEPRLTSHITGVADLSGVI